jgi:hypothetical protein
LEIYDSYAEFNTCQFENLTGIVPVSSSESNVQIINCNFLHCDNVYNEYGNLVVKNSTFTKGDSCLTTYNSQGLIENSQFIENIAPIEVELNSLLIVNSVFDGSIQVYKQCLCDLIVKHSIYTISTETTISFCEFKNQNNCSTTILLNADTLLISNSTFYNNHCSGGGAIQFSGLFGLFLSNRNSYPQNGTN